MKPHGLRCLLLVERAVPLGDRDGSDPVADQVGHGTGFVHEAIDAEQ